MSGVEDVRGGYGGGLYTSTGYILVLFILLVIISRTILL
ncbi:YjcZ family sporulation protein [Paenibacillus senegalimassiliensis]|nr:YjcZ family sporulation protein [Paenibacillus senegalimassiliensis]